METNVSTVNKKEKILLLFCERIKEERKQRGLTQEQLAKLAEITVQSQRSYESGKRTPDIAYLAKLEEAGFDTAYILTGERKAAPIAGLSNTERMKAVLDMSLAVIEEVQEERGVEFSADNLQTLMSYAHTYGTTKQALKAFVDTVFLLAKDLPTANQLGSPKTTIGG